MKNDSISARIKQLREQFGLKQGVFSDQLRMSQTHVSRIEKGKVPPSKSFLNALKREFGINPDWIMTGEGEMFIPPEEYIIADIQKLGIHKFSEGLTKILKDPEFAELRSLMAVSEMVTGDLDPQLTIYLQYILNKWRQGDEDIRGWLRIQMGIAFPEVVERLGEVKKE